MLPSVTFYETPGSAAALTESIILTVFLSSLQRRCISFHEAQGKEYETYGTWNTLIAQEGCPLALIVYLQEDDLELHDTGAPPPKPFSYYPR